MMTTALRRWSRLVVLALALPLASACEIAPEPLHIGAEECAHCSMLITERRYAAQLLTTKGLSYKFDAVECLRAFVLAGTVAAEDTHSVWVTDMDAAEGWVPVEQAAFVHSPELRTPMGGGLAAFATAEAAADAAERLNGVVFSWAGLLAAELPQHGHGHAHDSPAGLTGDHAGPGHDAPATSDAPAHGGDHGA
jgi:copper chaperone NosL